MAKQDQGGRVAVRFLSRCDPRLKGKPPREIVARGPSIPVMIEISCCCCREHPVFSWLLRWPCACGGGPRPGAGGRGELLETLEMCTRKGPAAVGPELLTDERAA